MVGWGRTEKYQGWSNKKLQNMANQGIQNYRNLAAREREIKKTKYGTM